MPEVSFVGVAVIQARAVQACTRAVAEAAEDLVGKAQPLARVRTGTLRASIHVEGVSPSGNGATAKVSTGGESSEYALFQHEGTRYMSGTHYLEEALLQNADVYVQHLQDAANSAF